MRLTKVCKLLESAGQNLCYLRRKSKAEGPEVGLTSVAGDQES